MGKFMKTYDAVFKKKVVDLYLEGELSYQGVGEKFNIDRSLVRRWVAKFKADGEESFKERRGKAKGFGQGRRKTRPESPNEKMKRLEAENELLKKLLKM